MINGLNAVFDVGEYHSYIQTFSASTTMYGSLGAVVVALLLWLFLSACCSSGRAERDDSLGGLEAGAPEARRSLEPRD